MIRGTALRRPGRLLAIAASVVVLATITVAVVTMGPPSAQRQVRLDQRRIDDLQRIVRLVELHARSHGALPVDLQTLASQPGQRLAITDPVDAAPYAYEVNGPRSFRLCAVFATDTARTDGDGHPPEEEWNHGSGRQCFERVVRRDPRPAVR